MGDSIKLAFVLMVVALVAGLAIAFTNSQTAGRIEQQKLLAQEQALKIVFPEGVSISEQDPFDQLPGLYWIAKHEENVVGYAFKGSGKGYASDIKFIVGVDPQGTILGLTILSQSETPGLGDRIQETVSTEYIWKGFLTLFQKKHSAIPWFTKQFKGIQVTKDIAIDKSGEWHTLSEKKQQELLDNNAITAITGATISTQAVCSSIKKYSYRYLSTIKKQQSDKKPDAASDRPVSGP